MLTKIAERGLLILNAEVTVPAITKNKKPEAQLVAECSGFSISRHPVLTFLRVEHFLLNKKIYFRLEIQNDKNFIKQFVSASSFCAG
jgi:hypothetical protein